jgi:hypothetical protein
MFRGELALVGLTTERKHWVTLFELPEMTLTPFATASVRIENEKEVHELRCKNQASREDLVSVFRSAQTDMGGGTLSLLWIPFCKSARLPPRDSHSVFFARGALWICRGRDRRGKIVGSLFRISTEPFEVRPIRRSMSPLPRLAFGYAVHRDVFYICGGSVDRRNAMGDFWTFDIESKTWWRIAGAGKRPPAAIGCSLVALENSLLLIGEGPIFPFQIADQCWESVGSPIGARSPWPAGFPIGPDSAFVVAGSANVGVLCVRENGENVHRVRAFGMPSIAQKKGNEGAELHAAACVAYEERIFVFADKEGMQAYGISMTPGQQKWSAIATTAKYEFLITRSSYAVIQSPIGGTTSRGGEKQNAREDE